MFRHWNCTNVADSVTLLFCIFYPSETECCSPCGSLLGVSELSAVQGHTVGSQTKQNDEEKAQVKKNKKSIL